MCDSVDITFCAGECVCVYDSDYMNYCIRNHVCDSVDMTTCVGNCVCVCMTVLWLIPVDTIHTLHCHHGFR